MHRNNLEFWQHDHIFDHDQKRAGESKTLIVTVLTAVMMAVEIAAGIVYGSMALLADGLHMASHAAALCVNVIAYVYARRHAADKRFSFGTGKVNALGGFIGALLLALFALAMAWESAKRMVQPVEISFDQAIVVAVIGLLVNLVSALILQVPQTEGSSPAHHHHDHNLRSAYLHVLADALTSLLAIGALLAAKYFGLLRIDPLTGILGAVLILRWAWKLLVSTSHTLLDQQGPAELLKKITAAIEQDGDSRVADLHLWAIGVNLYSAIISIVARHPKDPEQYKKMIPSDCPLSHVTVEVHQCKQDECR